MRQPGILRRGKTSRIKPVSVSDRVLRSTVSDTRPNDQTVQIRLAAIKKLLDHPSDNKLQSNAEKKDKELVVSTSTTVVMSNDPTELQCSNSSVDSETSQTVIEIKMNPQMQGDSTSDKSRYQLAIPDTCPKDERHVDKKESLTNNVAKQKPVELTWADVISTTDENFHREISYDVEMPHDIMDHSADATPTSTMKDFQHLINTFDGSADAELRTNDDITMDDILEIISQDGNYMERIEKDKQIASQGLDQK